MDMKAGVRPSALCAIRNGRYINVPTRWRVATSLNGVKPRRRVIQEAVHMQDDLEMRRRRAAYRACHRGTKEMDIVLGRYAEARLATMSEEELGTFERLLALPDPLLTFWFSQDGDVGDTGEFAIVIAALRAHHGLVPASPAAGLETQ